MEEQGGPGNPRAKFEAKIEILESPTSDVAIENIAQWAIRGLREFRAHRDALSKVMSESLVGKRLARVEVHERPR